VGCVRPKGTDNCFDFGRAWTNGTKVAAPAQLGAGQDGWKFPEMPGGRGISGVNGQRYFSSSISSSTSSAPSS